MKKLKVDGEKSVYMYGIILRPCFIEGEL